MWVIRPRVLCLRAAKWRVAKYNERNYVTSAPDDGRARRDDQCEESGAVRAEPFGRQDEHTREGRQMGPRRRPRCNGKVSCWQIATQSHFGADKYTGHGCPCEQTISRATLREMRVNAPRLGPRHTYKRLKCAQSNPAKQSKSTTHTVTDNRS